MYCSRHVCFLFALTLALFVCTLSSAQVPIPNAAAPTTVTLHWGEQPGISRFRLQLAHDREFGDIVFDRVVNGFETRLTELEPGRYFWRVAPLSARLGEYSATGILDIPASQPTVSNPSTLPSPASGPGAGVSARSWRAAIGNVTSPFLAHLRSRDFLDLVAVNSEGVVYLLDAQNGVSVWSLRSAKDVQVTSAVAISTRSALDNLLLLSGNMVTEVDGATGRQLWKANLPAAAGYAVALRQPSDNTILFIDISQTQLFIVNEANGQLVNQIKLPARATGAPVVINAQGKETVALSYESGLVEIRDAAGKVLQSGSVASAATTPPLVVHGARGELVLVGTRDGLTALTADTLRPLGRVSLKDDAPRGKLLAQDLNNDGTEEVLMTTVRGHVVA